MSVTMMLELLIRLAYQVKKVLWILFIHLKRKSETFTTNSGGFRIDMQPERKTSNFKFVENCKDA